VSTRARHAMIFLGVGALLAGGVVLAMHRRQSPTRSDPLGAVPSDAQVVMVANLSVIRGSPYRGMFGSSTVPSLVPGAEDGCGRNLSERVETLVVWEPSEPGASFGIAARAPVRAQSVWECARGTMASRGAAPTFAEVEGFWVITDERLGPGAAQIAVEDSGLLLLARPGTRSRMMDAVAGRTPSALGAGPHARMRGEVGPGDMTVTVVVSPALREGVARWLDEPVALERVEGVACAADLRSTTEVRAIVWCESESVCDALADRMGSMRSRAMGSLAMRATGVAALLEATSVEREGPRLRVRAKLPAEQVIDIAQRLDRLQEQWSTPSPRVPAPAGSGADETLRPTDSSGR